MYSKDFKKITIKTYFFIKSLRKTANFFNISHMTVSRWYNELYLTKFKNNFINKETKTFLIKEVIENSIKNDPFVSLINLKIKIFETFNLNVSKELIRLAIKKFGFTKKKAKFFGKPKNLEEKTINFIKLRDEYIKQNKNFISLDEVSFGRKGIIQKGYSIKGIPLKIAKIQPRIETTSYLVACNSKEILKKEGLVGSFNTDRFFNFINNMKITNNTVILLDNVPFHHSKIIKNFANQNNIILLYTPPYSPWFNPIEGIFSIIKRHYYKNNSILDSFNQVTELHCNKFFKYSMSYK